MRGGEGMRGGDGVRGGSAPTGHGTRLSTDGGVREGERGMAGGERRVVTVRGLVEDNGWG